MTGKLLLCSLLAGVVTGACPFQGPASEMSEEARMVCPHAMLQAEPEHTKLGCTCKSTCSATVDDGFNCDWCYTLDSCGQSGLTGKWDYCVYPANATTEAAPWQQKLDFLWNKITADNVSGVYPNVLNIVSESVQTSFDKNADVMNEGRVKYIHSVGAVCKVNFKIAASSPYTGLLKAGTTVHGLVRMGSALAVTTKSGVVPGIGVKLMRSKVQSGNFVALNSLNALPDNNYNFFALPVSNHIAAPDTAATKIVAAKFAQASGCATQVGLSDICQYDMDGVKVDDASLVFPHRVSLTSPLNLPSAPVGQAELQRLLVSSVPSGAVLYNVTAYASPSAPGVTLGVMTTDGPCSNSAFGDASLFFKHQLIEDDWNLKPEWLAAVDPMADCGVESVSLTPPPQCTD